MRSPSTTSIGPAKRSRPSHSVVQLGADEVCDYAAEAFEQKWAANPFDAVLDTIVLKGYEQRRQAAALPG